MGKKGKGKLSANGKFAIASGIVLALAAGAVVAVTAVKRSAIKRGELSSPEFIIEDAATAAEQSEKEKTEQRKASWLSALGSVLMGAVSFVITAAFRLALFIIGGLFSPVGGLVAFIAEMLVTFLLMLLLFGILFKKLFPERKLKELYTFKNLCLFALGSFVITGAKTLAVAFSPLGAIPTALIECGVSTVVFALVWYLAFKQTGYLGVQIKKEMLGKKGLAALGIFCGTTVVSALLKVLISGLAVVGPYAGLAASFVLCAAVALTAGWIVRSVQKRLDFRVLSVSKTAQLARRAARN